MPAMTAYIYFRERKKEKGKADMVVFPVSAVIG
jgi:hypothetical protein